MLNMVLHNMTIGKSIRKSFLIILWLCSLFASPCFAKEDISIGLSLDRNKATTMDTIRMTVKVTGARSVDSRPILRGLDAFDVFEGGTSSRVEIINGRMSAGIDYTYRLQPREAGNFTIGPATVKVDGKVYTSNPVTLKIIEPEKISGESRGPLFLTASLSSAEIYAGYQTIYDLKLYHQTAVSNLSLRLPEAEHLSFRQLGKPVEYNAHYNDETYQVLEVRYALIPSREGTFGIRSSRMNLVVARAGRRSPFDLFDDPFFSSMTGEQKAVASEPLELKVLPLPEKGRPEDFSGLVGRFEMDSRLEPAEIKEGDSATLTVVIKGRGDAKQIPDLKMPEQDKIKVYSDKPVLTDELDADGLTGSKTMKWALVPEEEGKYPVPPLTLSYFDTSSGQYRTLKTKPFLLSVRPGKEEKVQPFLGTGQEQATATANKKQVKELGRDILPIHGSARDLHANAGLTRGGAFYGLLLFIPLGLYLAVFTSLKLARRSPASLGAVKAKRAARNLIRKSCTSGISSRELILAFQNYLNDRLGLSIGALTSEEARDVLASFHVGDDTAKEVHGLLRRLEDAVYTGKGDEPCSIHEDMQGLVKRLEKEIR